MEWIGINWNFSSNTRIYKNFSVLFFLSKSGRFDWEIWHPKLTRMSISGIIYRLFLISANIVWDQSISNCLSQNYISSFWSNRQTPLAETELQKVQPSQVFHTTANFTTKRSNMSSFFYIELKYPSEISVRMSYANLGGMTLHCIKCQNGSLTCNLFGLGTPTLFWA